LAAEDTDRTTRFPFPPELFFRSAVADVDHRLRLALSTLEGVRPPAPLTNIVERVARAFRIPPETLRSKSRVQHLAFCRQVAMFVCRRAGASFPTIGHELNRHHSSVIHGFGLVQKRFDTELAFRSFIEKLEAAINGSSIPAPEAAA